MEKMFLSVVLIAVSLFAIANYGNMTGNLLEEKNATVCFGDNCLECSIADNPAEQSTGLMYRESLPENECMFFVFSYEDYHTFWMKNVKFPLDIIWITREKYVTHIQSVEPCLVEPCKTYKPSAPAMYVVEANLGYTLKNNISVGSTAVIKESKS